MPLPSVTILSFHSLPSVLSPSSSSSLQGFSIVVIPSQNGKVLRMTGNADPVDNVSLEATVDVRRGKEME